MYFSKAIALAFVASLPAAFGSPALRERQTGVTCQTSHASPWTGDVTHAINELKGQGGSCPQDNGEASDCTTLISQDTAAISICGEVDDDDSTFSCEAVADYADQIQQACLDGAPADPNTRTGGTFTISPSKRIELH